jgi:hypothetical protein
MKITFNKPAKVKTVKVEGPNRDIEVLISATKRSDDYGLPCGPPAAIQLILRNRVFFPAAAGNADDAARSGLVLDAVYGAASDPSWELDREARNEWPEVEIEVRAQGGIASTYTLRGLTVQKYHVPNGFEELIMTAREVEQKVANGSAQTLKTNIAREAAGDESGE